MKPPDLGFGVGGQSATLSGAMVMLPIVDRELRVTARRAKTYWLRLAAALAAILVCFWVCVWTARAQSAITLGKSLFSALTVLGFGYCLLVGPFISADCLSEEKREGTLGLLFLTDLRSYDVVLGKWLAASLAGFYGLLAILPALGLPLLLGGVTPAEYARVAFAIVNAILFSLTAGLFVSSLSREQAKAVFGSALLILGVSGLAPGLATVFSTGFFTKPLSQFPSVVLASPAYTGYLALDAAFRAAPRDYWFSLGIVHGFCWLFMLLTVLIVPRVWRETPQEKPATRRWFWRFGYTRGWRRLFARRLERNPVFALAARLRWPHLVFWCLVALVAINVFWLTYGYRHSPGSGRLHLYFSSALVFTNRVWITAMACWFFLEARRTGALELLLTTPMPVKTLLRGHWRALRRLFVWPVLIIALLHVFYVMGSASQSASAGLAGRLNLRYSAYLAAGSFFKFITDVFALCWVGAWLSLSSKKATFAMLKTYCYVILVPWFIAYFAPNAQALILPKLANYPLLRPFVQSVMSNTLMSYYLWPPACWVLKNVLFIAWARYKLRKHFRAAAAQAYRHGPSCARRWPWSPRCQPALAALAVGGQMARDA